MYSNSDLTFTSKPSIALLKLPYSKILYCTIERKAAVTEMEMLNVLWKLLRDLLQNLNVT